MYMKLQIVALLFTFGQACQDVTTVSSFKLEDFSKKRWFEIARYSSIKEEKDADCVYFDMTYNPAASNYTTYEVVKGKTILYNGKWSTPTNAGIILDDSFMNGEKVNFTYYILDTDNSDYYVFYYCTFDEQQKKDKESAWILSRTPKLSDKSKMAVTKDLETSKYLDANKFVWNHFTHQICLLDV